MKHETWKPVYEWDGIYEASDLGRVRSLDKRVNTYGGRNYIIKGKVLKPSPDTDGYPLVGLRDGSRKQTKTVHKVVLQAFVGPRIGDLQCCHKDGNKLNSALSNLEWNTIKKNHNDKRRHGTMIRGAAVNRSKLSEAQVIELRLLSSKGATRVALAKSYGVSDQTVRNILLGRTWKHINDGLSFSRKRAPNAGSFGAMSA